MKCLFCELNSTSLCQQCFPQQWKLYAAAATTNNNNNNSTATAAAAADTTAAAATTTTTDGWDSTWCSSLLWAAWSRD